MGKISLKDKFAIDAQRETAGKMVTPIFYPNSFQIKRCLQSACLLAA